MFQRIWEMAVSLRQAGKNPDRPARPAEENMDGAANPSWFLDSRRESAILAA